MKHIRTLDGVRGFAVIIVMLFHLEIPGFSLGWAGVPLFFCLSGFLITGILLEQKQQPFKEYLGGFLLNRLLRIFPLFYAYLLVNYLFLKATGQSAAGYIWFILYLQNLYIGITGTTPGFVIQTWSLAAEEQFYWLWPLAIFFLKGRVMVKVFIPLIIFSLLARSFIYHASGNNPYMFNATLLSCTDALILGALFAKIKDYKSAPRVAFWMLLAGLALSAYAVITTGLSAFWLPSGWVGKCGYLPTSMAMVFTAIIFYVYHWDKQAISNPLASVLENKFLVYTGKISYGLYMWHLACFFAITVIGRKFGVDNHSLIFFIIALLFAYLVSTLSYYLFEVHFLKLKRKARRTVTSPNGIVL
ncbi:acyltransferase family protein [Rouxiella sp. WC2420]|uniref:Acyltransferase family protein n=1 Tax=Rouxiella sp. WC2420 TaxID=3234145 RepID=A0AB39VRF8_9GAMM